MLDEWEMLYLGTGIVMCRRITTDRMSDSSGVHGGHGALGAGEQVQVHANVPGGRRNKPGVAVFFYGGFSSHRPTDEHPNNFVVMGRECGSR